MVFVEVFRLIVVLVGALVGLAAGTGMHSAGARILGAAIGVLVGYVAGGIAGRLLDKGVLSADRALVDVPAIEVLAGSFLAALGFLVGAALSVPLFVFVRHDWDYPIGAGIAWVFAGIGLKIGSASGRRLAQAARITRRLEPTQQVPAGAIIVDTSAVMDRAFYALAQHGLLGREILLPEPVADELSTLAEGPDPVSSRRAHRALETIRALKEAGVNVTVVPGDEPEAALTEEKALRLAQRLGVRLFTCSADVARQREQSGVDVVDLRALAAELAPDHVPGERLRVDLIRAGRQEGQAIGYLPDGDMVVVNDASELVGSEGVEVVVLSTRATSQGLLVFGRLASREDEGALRAL